MRATPPRAWPYTAGGSPEPLPNHAWLQSSRIIHPMRPPSQIPAGDTIDGEGVLQWMADHEVEDADGSTLGSLGDLMVQRQNTPLVDRRLFLVPGELGNPYRLADIGIAEMPIIPIRLDGLCRTWTDVLDGREVSPGVHHITIARTRGWWENSLLAAPDTMQARRMTEWLNDGPGTAWRWNGLAEGSISLCPGADAGFPTPDQLSWDGEEEWVDETPPDLSGPVIEPADLTVVLFTRQGVYDHRGRLARCRHHPQRSFHSDIFRRGSAKAWNRVIETL